MEDSEGKTLKELQEAAAKRGPSRCLNTPSSKSRSSINSPPWAGQVIDQGPGVPTDPTKSLRTSFREVILEGVFRQSLHEINRTEQGQPWLTDKQIDDLIDEILNQPAKSLVEANEAVLKLLYRAQVDVNEVTGEQYPNVKLIDFEHPERNHFLAINQFRIDTPGAGKGFIIPDIVLFVNGLPLVVIECKDANDFTANPMYEAFQQLMRYSDQREETKQAGLREGEPKLFFTNQLLIRTCGDQADFGTITATDEEFFFPWKDIYPGEVPAVHAAARSSPAAGNADPGDAAQGDAARPRANLHRVHGCRQGPGRRSSPATSSTGPSARSSTGCGRGRRPKSVRASSGTRRDRASRSRWSS